MHKFKRDTLPVNLKHYFTRVNQIHNHSTRFSEINYYNPRVNSLYDSKTLSYLGCSKVWEEIQRNPKRLELPRSFSICTKNYLN